MVLKGRNFNMNTPDRANILLQALPYIRKYFGKTVVIKYGGNAMISEELKETVMNDLIMLSFVGINVVLVHGGGPEINDMLRRVGKEPKFINGLRYTDSETMEIVQTVLCGKVNKDLVSLLERHGGKAVGLCGLDGSLLTAKKYSKADVGLVGEITGVNTTLITDVIRSGYIPVIATVAGGQNASEVYNINADTAASRIASELNAAKLILMTDTKGLLEDMSDENSLIAEVGLSDVPRLKSAGIISGGMIPKVDCCVEAVRRGVGHANIIDGRIPHSILIEMLSDEGSGTLFK